MAKQTTMLDNRKSVYSDGRITQVVQLRYHVMVHDAFYLWSSSRQSRPTVSLYLRMTRVGLDFHNVVNMRSFEFKARRVSLSAKLSVHTAV